MQKEKATASRTRMVTFSVFPATAENIRSCADHFGSVGRAVQVAIEILHERAQKGELFQDQDDDVIDNLRLLGRNVNINSRVAQDSLKVPFAFSILPRTERLIQFLADPKFYSDRNVVIMFCGTLLPQLYSDFIEGVLTRSERQQRRKKLNAKLDEEVEASWRKLDATRIYEMKALKASGSAIRERLDSIRRRKEANAEGKSE